MRLEIWYHRSFDLTIPLDRFPAILARLRGTPARLDESVRALPAATLVRRIDNTWSIQENIGHLIDLEPLWLRRAN